MLAELAAANAAFQVIKATIKNSGEIIQAGQAVFDYFDNKSKLQEKLADNPQKQRSDLEEFFALEQLKQQEQELKELMIYAGRPGLWDDWLAFQKQARQRREDEERQRIKADLDRKAKRKKLLETIMLTFWMIVLVITVTSLAAFGIYIALEIK
jgi:hypothetical protein